MAFVRVRFEGADLYIPEHKIVWMRVNAPDDDTGGDYTTIVCHTRIGGNIGEQTFVGKPTFHPSGR